MIANAESINISYVQPTEVGKVEHLTLENLTILLRLRNLLRFWGSDGFKRSGFLWVYLIENCLNLLFAVST